MPSWHSGSAFVSRANPIRGVFPRRRATARIAVLDVRGYVPDVPRVKEVLCMLEKDRKPRRVLEITLAAPSL